MPDAGRSSNINGRPSLRTSDGRTIKASQRDLRRYCIMQQRTDQCRKTSLGAGRYRDHENVTEDDSEEAPLISGAFQSSVPSSVPATEADSDIVHAETWGEAAYRSLG